MELILQRELPHQQKAIDSICSVFDGVNITKPVQLFENPLIDLKDPKITSNINSVQKNIPLENRNNRIDDYLNLDIKMETGTGKTYVYTKTMFELHKRYGLNKFIIAVPSLAIKSGTGQFLQDDYVRRHFSDSCGYGTDIEVGILASVKKKKTGHLHFPSVVREFVMGSHHNKNKIYVLVVNMQLLSASKMLTRDDYDYSVEGFYRPFNAISATKPIMIIDEPHRFSRNQKAFKVITEEIKPQSIIRFGATFPEVTTGTGKNKTIVKDYENLLYDLNACESFNHNLIKGVAKEHFEPLSQQNEKVKITSIQNKDSVTFQYKKRDKSTKTYTFGIGDSLSLITEAFEGVNISNIGKSDVEFSNGVIKNVGEELAVDIYMTSYQEQMLRLALERHFDTERENFSNRTFKIKTLALFFIDDITSYRPDTDGKSPYLLLAFERLLKETIQTVLNSLNEHEEEYHKYLEASLDNISACHAGYFSKDNNDSDESIAQEVDVILNGKKQLLSFKNENGNYNTLRFLFSKWTLKEGWDNPNVFTIAKLRSSGSENSKLQEVGRGLRLPVDENGNRISNEEFLLNYIVDFTEADFADRLIEEINGEVPQANVISEQKLQEVANKKNMSSDELFDLLYSKNYIDRIMNIRPENREAFFAEFPDFSQGISSNKVENRNEKKRLPIKIRKDAYLKIKDFWETINQPCLLFYDKNLDTEIGDVVLELLEKINISDVIMTSSRDIIRSNGSQVTAEKGTGVQYRISQPISYNAFLKRIMRVTNIPITTMHQALSLYAQKYGTLDLKYFNENTVSIFCSEFYNWKSENLQGRFKYIKTGVTNNLTALTYKDGTPREDIAQGRIGTKIVPGSPSDKYLYDSYVYDSPLEKENITSDIEEVIVYGKIPRNSIAIPTITGGTYSPDFLYVVKKSSGESEINIIVETKDVENKTDLRGIEKTKIDCARIFFDTLTKEGYTVHFRDQLNNKQMAQLIDEVLEN